MPTVTSRRRRHAEGDGRIQSGLCSACESSDLTRMHLEGHASRSVRRDSGRPQASDESATSHAEHGGAIGLTRRQIGVRLRHGLSAHRASKSSWGGPDG